MFLKAYTILDTKTGAYSQPWFFASDGAAVRAIIDLGNDVSTLVGKHPADFVFYSIGGFDDATGMLQPLEVFSFGSVQSLITRPAVQIEG